jgi:hypothetical protein
MPLDSFVIPVKVDTSQVSKGLRGVSNQFKNLSTQLKSTGQALTLGLTAPLALLGRQFVKTASDAEETQAKFSAVFKELTGEAEDFVQSTAQELGRSTNDLRAFMGTLQDTFVPLGFARDQGLEMSKALTKLTLDLASFNNMAQPEVLRALQSAIVGNHETVRRFGVIINQTVLSQELMNMGIKDGVKNATEAQKAQARLNIIIKGTSDAQGDALRTSGSFANQVRRLTSQFEEFAVEIGNILIPVINKMISFFGDLIQKFRDLSGEQKVLVVALGTILVALGPIMTALGAIISPIGLVITSFIALSKIIYDNSDTIIEALVFVINKFVELYNKSLLVRGVVQSLFFAFKTFFGAVQTGIKNLVTIFSGLGKIVANIFNFEKVKQIVKETFSEIGDNVVGFGQDVANNFTKGINETIKGKLEFTTKESIKTGLSNSITKIKDFILDKAKQFGFEIPKSISQGITDASDLVTQSTDKVGEKLTTTFDEIKEKGTEMANEVGSVLSQFGTDLVSSFELAETGLQGFMRKMMETFIKLSQMAIQNLIVTRATNRQKVQNEAQTIAQIAGLRLAGLGNQAAALTAKMGLDQASATSSAIAGASASAAATGPAAIFTQPAFIATMVGGVLAAFASIPKFAKGGIVTGPTLGLVGEAGPEAIIPLNKLEGMMKGGSKGEFVLRGQDLILALERAGDFRARVTG